MDEAKMQKRDDLTMSEHSPAGKIDQKIDRNEGREFDLNIEKTLDNWDIYHAIREIIANALDEQIITETKDISIFKDQDDCWHIVDYGRGIKGGGTMDLIRPVSDLRNHFTDISKTVHETSQPVFLTKNGYGDMVVMSIEAFENLQFESEVYLKLKKAEQEADRTSKRYSSKEVLSAMREAIEEDTGV